MIPDSVQVSMSNRSSEGFVGKTSIVSNFISETSLGCSIFNSFSMFLTISASSPGLYAEEVSNCGADCLSPVWIVLFVDKAVQCLNVGFR